jgi:hypothetical protein
MSLLSRLPLLLLPLLIGLVGCAPRKVELHYRAAPVLNSRTPEGAQPVLIGLYPLMYVPSDLADSACTSFERPERVATQFKDALAGEVAPISATPGTAHDRFSFDRSKDAKFLLIVPFYEGKCQRDIDADTWAVVRLSPVHRKVWLRLEGYKITLPMAPLPQDADGHWKERGCVEGVRVGTTWSWCR